MKLMTHNLIGLSRWALPLCLLLNVTPVMAQGLQPFHPTGLLSLEIARPLLLHDPSVIAARHGLDVARQEAALLERSPHEWTARVAELKRRVDGAERFREWNATIERAIRLPNKAAGDQAIGQAINEEAEAHYGEAIHEAARTLSEKWLDWVIAAQLLQYANEELKNAQATHELIEKRQQAGDAATLEVNQSRAELADIKRKQVDAQTQLEMTWEQLAARFPGINQQLAKLPEPWPIAGALEGWLAHILEQSDERKIAVAQSERAQAQVTRTRADKVPDPTIGLFSASEFGGRERTTGVTLSIPLPGAARSIRADKAIAERDKARAQVAQVERELRAGIAASYRGAQGGYTGYLLSRDAQAAAQESARQMQRAFALGEAGLAELLLAQRQAGNAVRNALQAREMALRHAYRLLIDGHLIWGLEHD